LVAGIHDRLNYRKDHHLRTGSHDDIFRINSLRMLRGKVLRDSRTQFPDTGNRRVVGGAFLKPIDAGTHHRFRCIEVRFADLQMDNISTLPLQFSSPSEHFECGLTPDTMHSFSDPAFRIHSHSVNSLSKENDLKV